MNDFPEIIATRHFPNGLVAGPSQGPKGFTIHLRARDGEDKPQAAEFVNGAGQTLCTIGLWIKGRELIGFDQAESLPAELCQWLGQLGFYGCEKFLP